jgi:hypothetical protein
MILFSFCFTFTLVVIDILLASTPESEGICI